MNMPSFKKILDHEIADAPPENWVMRYAPYWARPFLQLSRIDRPIGTWLLLLPSWWGLLLAMMGSGERIGLKELHIGVILFFGAWLMRGAGCTWNDISDRHFDAKITRTKNRPIPSGRVSVPHAVIWMILQALMAFAFLLTLQKFAIFLGILALVPVLIYPFAKRVTWWPQVFLGIAFNWGVLLGWAAQTNTLSFATLCLYFAGLLWTLIYDTIYAHQDSDDDALVGIKSTARLFGKKTYMILYILAFLCVFFMVLAVFVAVGAHGGAGFIWALMGVLAFGGHLLWQLKHLDITRTETCLHIFRSNRDAGALIVIFWTIGIFFV